MRKSARLQHHSCEIQDIGSSNPRVIGIIKFYRIDAIVGIRLSISDMWVSFKIRDRNIVPLLHHNRIRDNTQHNCAFDNIQCFQYPAPSYKIFSIQRNLMKELNVTATKVKKKGNTRRLLRHYVSAITYRKVKMAEANCIIGTRVAKSGITCRYTTRIALIKPWRKISTSYEFSFFFFRETREFYTPVERKRKREKERERKCTMF